MFCKTNLLALWMWRVGIETGTSVVRGDVGSSGGPRLPLCCLLSLQENEHSIVMEYFWRPCFQPFSHYPWHGWSYPKIVSCLTRSSQHMVAVAVMWRVLTNVMWTQRLSSGLPFSFLLVCYLDVTMKTLRSHSGGEKLRSVSKRKHWQKPPRRLTNQEREHWVLQEGERSTPHTKGNQRPTTVIIILLQKL